MNKQGKIVVGSPEGGKPHFYLCFSLDFVLRIKKESTGFYKSNNGIELLITVDI